MSARILAPFLLGVLFLEIAVFVLVGREIGVAATLGLTFATAVVGVILLRQQGFAILSQISDDVEAGRMPSRSLVHGGLVLAAGFLLLIPGFVTDAIGLALFVPWVRDAVWRTVLPRIETALERRSQAGWPI